MWLSDVTVSSNINKKTLYIEIAPFEEADKNLFLKTFNSGITFEKGETRTSVANKLRMLAYNVERFGE